MDRLAQLQAYIELNKDDPDLWIYEMFVKFEMENIAKIDEYRKLHPEHKKSSLFITVDDNYDCVITPHIAMEAE